MTRRIVAGSCALAVSAGWNITNIGPDEEGGGEEADRRKPDAVGVRLGVCDRSDVLDRRL